MTSASAKRAKVNVDRGGKRQRYATFGDGAGAGGGAKSGVAATLSHRSPRQGHKPLANARLAV
jgi:hypothetical protein